MDEKIYDSEGLPICPSCNKSMWFISSGDRDTETMGGYGVTYCYCNSCKNHFEIICGDISRTDGPSNFDEDEN